MGQDALESNPYLRRIKALPRFISLSKFHENQFHKNYGLRSVIIPWGVSPEPKILIEKSIDVIGVGSLVTLKAYDEFIKTIGALREIYPDICCAIVGDGILRKSLRDQIESERLNESLILVGSLPYRDTQAMISRSKILLHLSKYESFGMAVIEALSLQTLVVSKAVGIAAEIEEVVKIECWQDAVVVIKGILEGPQLPPPLIYAIRTTVSNYLRLYN
jgi:glycosyltransferase involved in cell wall biosynthesis